MEVIDKKKTNLFAVSRDRTWVVGALLASFFAITPVVIVFGIRPIIFAIIFACLLLISTLNRWIKYPLLYGFLVLTFFSTSTLHGLLTGTTSNILYPLILSISIALVFSATHASIIILLKFCTAILFLVLIGGVIAFVWGGIGLPALGYFQNPDGRTNYILPFSLSNSVHQGVIRPSGIFDEPGALSFFVCAVAFTRHIMGLRKSSTWALLTLGLVTLSLAHLFYIFFHFIGEDWKVKVRVAFFGITFIVIAAFAISLAGFTWDLDARFIHRLYHPEFGLFQGAEGRLLLHNTALLYIDSIQSFLFGYPELTLSYGSTPFAPIIERGFLVVWPHYGVLFLAFSLSLIMLIRGKPIGFMMIGFYALFLQRPAVMATSYSFWAILPLFLLFTRNPGLFLKNGG